MGRSYRDRDYSFGQTILKLRTAIGLTQTGLAEHLGISRFAVGEWEAGNKYPKIEHLRPFIELALQQSAFHAGHEADEIRALWKASHQKVLLDEQWLSTLLSVKYFRITATSHVLNNGTVVDWGDALAIPNFYGREWEINLLTTWMVEKRCRVVSALGLGGIGKSTLAVNLMRRVAEHFEVVIWRSLRDAPSCESLIDNLFQTLEPSIIDISVSLEQRFSLLLDYLRKQRVLLVLDNLESILEEGEGTGQMRPGYQDYGRLLHRVAETEHQSCLLLTSREKPNDLIPLEGTDSPVRSLRLTKLDFASCQQLLAEKGAAGTEPEYTQLIEGYGGNPLALKIVAQTIVDIFDGEITAFLEQGELIFGGVRELLRQQFNRLSPLEQRILVWLAILREPTSLNELSTLMVNPVPRVRLLEAMDALHRRSLVERGQKPGNFTLQSVVLEFVIAQLVAQVSGEIEQRRFVNLIEHGLELAQGYEYVRQTQERLILMPILTRLRGLYPEPAGIESLLIECLNELRAVAESAQGYAPANLLALLMVSRGHLRELDLSRLMLRNVYLQGVEMHDSLLTEASIRDCVFTETFDGISSLSISRSGAYWAATTYNGEIRVWEAGGRLLYRLWQNTSLKIWQTALSSDGSAVVWGGVDGNVKLWEVASNTLIWSSSREFNKSEVLRMEFSPDDSMIVVSCADSGVHLLDSMTGKRLETLPHVLVAPGIGWHPNGAILATSDIAGTIRLWSIRQGLPSTIVMTIEAHKQPITGLPFSPYGNWLASASWDETVKVWDIADGTLQSTLTGHRDRVHRVAWSADGQVIASSGRAAVWLWDVEHRRYRAALHGHTGDVRAIAFTPDSRQLVSGSDDGTLRVWDTATGACSRIIHGYDAIVYQISWSPDQRYLLSFGSEPFLTLFGLDDNLSDRALRGAHQSRLTSAVWSPAGRFIASGEVDNVIRLWDGNTGESLDGLRFPEEPATYFQGIDWSPDGLKLAAGTPTHGILLFDVTTRSGRSFGKDAPTWIGYVEWSPDGMMVVGTGENNTIYVWAANTDELLHQLPEPELHIVGIAWSADSTRLVIIGADGGIGKLFVWHVTQEEQAPLLIEHPSMIVSVTWAANDQVLITGDQDGALHWWNVQTGECIRQLEVHKGKVNSLRLSPDKVMLASCGDDGVIGIRDVQTGALLKTLRFNRPYERLNITGIRGLSDAQKQTLGTLGAVENQ